VTAARARLEEAVNGDPTHAPSHMALAQAWAALGYDGRAQEEAGKAQALAGPLPREQRLAALAYHRLVMHQWAKAAEAYGTLFDFFPDNLDYGLRLVEAEWHGTHARRALETIERLRSLPAPARDDPRIELARAETLLALGDHQGVVQAAVEAE